ncbi:Sporulation related domain-containing protein [Nonlabens sp. Hel1_33_55]|uniref:HU domain-containing protein n=1 Tax=Nonlabens sp. Hel1_33_55 TaxID=1336802 RepID=UPI000875F022|nr:SPOR domain-containing protein [Nonlabens sp. Hel1_33_55]SCY35212.1 Sporulation related domain-containing protein [Nonlabens sp. Hel1_33_55]
MQVAAYISDLLYRHECVVIPNFGAFISRRVPAQYFESTHTLYPPKKGLSFNEQIKQNDGLLVNYISTVEKLPYEDAMQEIRNYVRFLDHEMDEKGEITIHKVGRFTRTAENALSFTPMYLVNYLPEAFGLSMQETYAIDRTAVPVEKPTPQPVASISKMEPAPSKTNEPVEKPVRQLETPASRSAAWVRAAAAVAILVAGSYAGLYSYQTQQFNDAVAVEEMANEQLKSKIQEASFFISTPLPSVTMEVAPIVKNYHVVAGAFRDPANADKKVTQLKALGYDAERIGVNKYGLHNVAYASFAERNDAINELYRIRKQGNDGAWLLSGSLKK